MQQILRFSTRPATWVRNAVLAAAAVSALAMAPRPAGAQGLFSPAIRVNDAAITNFELEQRILFMTLLRVPGDPEKQARKALIEERLKQQAIDEAGITVDPEQIQQGIEQLASRTQLEPDEFVKALQQEGVAPETLRDFVRVGLAWRDFVAQKFLEQARPTEDEIDRAIGQGGAGGGIQVLLSEIIMPVTPQTVAQIDQIAEQISRLEGYDAFAQAAARYSATDTRTDGGKLGWLALNKLPPGLQSVVLDLKPGEITSPITLPNAVALFQMRGIREAAPASPRYSAIDYAMYYIPGGRTPEALGAAKALRDRVDTCDDLYGVAKDQPPEVLDRQSLPPGEIPQDVALELAKLDDGEVSTALTRSNGRTLVFLMMCGRTADVAADASREDVANALAQQRLNTYAESYLQQLLAEARIVEQ